MGKPATILTIETTQLGGVPSLVGAVYRMMESWGWQPMVTWAQSAPVDVTPWQRLAFTARRMKPRSSDERGDERIILVPAMPVPFWLSYLSPHYLAGQLIHPSMPVFVCSGSAHVALPLALRRIPYVLWIATIYEDELLAKAAAGESWARRILHSPTWSLLQAQERLALRRATRVLALSDTTARRIAETVPGVRAKIETVYYPVDSTFFHPAPEERARSPYGKYLLMVGRTGDTRKNVDLLIRAFADVRKEHPDVRLVLAGEEPGEASQALIRSLGVDDAIVQTGVIPHDDLLHLYQGAQLFVLPSRQEGLGIVVLEAMACGTPVISTRSGGPENLILGGETGCLVPLDDPKAMADVINELLDNPAQLDRMRTACVDYARTRCSWDAIEPQMRRAFDDVLEAISASKDRVMLREIFAALWALFVVIAFVQQQLALHWAAVQTQIIAPLLNRLP